MDSAPSHVVVASFRSPAEAQAARAAIEEAGIESTLVRDQMIGIGVVVAAKDADRAIDLLRDLWPDPGPWREEEPPVVEVERCPECGSPDLIRIRRLPFFIVFSTVMVAIGYAVGQRDLFGLLVVIVAALLFLGPNRRCLTCGALWRSMGLGPRASGLGVPRSEVAVEPPDVPCPRCGSPETAPIDRRRQKALTLLVHFILPPLLLLWPFMPKRKCEECGHEFR
ncbi:MAG TPA: hypothetical protein VM779_00880 [Thermoanaerobaculia bacterium]|nr:hypothetical protein [Thermoanaerobaculia bacterium]